MSKILRRCLSLALVVMLLASLTINGTINASADNKTGDGLAAYAMRAYNEGWSYVWGGASPGAVDCSGLIYSYVEGGERTTEAMLNASPESGYVSDGVPDIPGIALWQPGHVGVYVGDGMAVDARDEISNVCYQSVATKSWVMWFKVDGVSYGTDTSAANNEQSDEDQYIISSESTEEMSASDADYLSLGSTGSEVTELQERLKELGYFNEDTTQYFGYVTQASLVEFQTEAGLTADGVYNDETKNSLMSDYAPSKSSDIPENEDESFADDSEETVNIPTVNGEEPSSDNEDTLTEDDFSQQSSEEAYPDETDTYPSNSVVFTYGDLDEGVSNVQFILIKLGYYHEDITGYYDEKTFNAVEFFQLDHDIPATGSVDENTLNIMFNDFADKYSQTDGSAAEAADEEISSEAEVNISEEKSLIPSGSSETLETKTETTEITETTEAAQTTDDTAVGETNDSASAEENTAEPESAADDSASPEETETTAAIPENDTDTSANASVSDDTDTEKNAETVLASDSGKIITGGTNEAASLSAGSTVKSPRTGDPLVMTFESAVEYFNNYVNTTLVLIGLGVLFVIVFFAGTVHYWNVSMEKRRQRARKATTVSVYRRSSL